MNSSGFITSLVTSFLIFLALLLAFARLSRLPGNFVIYYPNRILKGLGPPPLARRRSPFAWIRDAWHAPEEEIVAMGGLDAAVYIAFLGSALSILAYTSIFCLPVLLPLSATEHGNTTSVPSNFTNFDKLSISNVSQGSNRLWAFVLAAYWMSIVTYFVLWKTYKHVLKLRAQDQASPRGKPQHFTVLVRDIPPAKSGTQAEEVDAFFKKLHPNTYESSVVVTDINKVLKIWTKLETYKRNLAHAEVAFAESKTSNNLHGTRPRHRTAFLGLIGPKVDSIDFYNEKLKELIPQLEEEQKRTELERQQGAAFVFFNSRPAATSASQVMHGQSANIWSVMPAPEPREVVWGNLPIPFVQRLTRQFIVYGIVFLTICFYMIPITFISALISLDNLTSVLPFLKPVVKQREIGAVLQAYLPQITLIVFLLLLPMLLMMLSKMEGIPSQSHMVRAAAGKYFYFIVFNVFLGVTIAGTLFTSLGHIMKSPQSAVSILSNGLPKQATFFITYVALQLFVGNGLQLTRLTSLIIYHLKRKFICKTQQELREAWVPGQIGYVSTVPGDLLIMTITLCYAVIAPMILPFAIVYFAIAWLVMRNQVLNVYVPEFESGGRMWPHIHTRILAALFVSQITMLGFFGIKKFKFSPIMLPLPMATVVVGYICRQFYYPSFKVTPLSVSCNEVKELPPLPSLVQAYTPTCLLPAENFEDTEMHAADTRSNISCMQSSGDSSSA